MSRRKEQVAETIAHAAALFLARESNQLSLITVTRAEISPDLKEVTIYFSVLPETMEKKVLAFTRRIRSDFREYLKETMPIGHIPTVDFAIDAGEKNRQRIDDLTRN